MLLAVLVALQSPNQFEGEVSFKKIQQEASKQYISYKTMPERMEFFTRQLLDIPYKGWTLERDEDTEFCFVTLAGLDCVTFAETVLGLSNVRWNSRAMVTEDNLVRAVQFTRYRGGRVDGYLSRLHYTSDWIFDNANKRVVKDITKSLPGAVKFEKQINFMSSNPHLYRQLKANASLIDELKVIEKAITAREKWYVPKQHVATAEKFLQTGDIIAITDSRPGMDCAHVGLIVVENGVAKFAHANSVAKRTMIDVRLSDYMRDKKGQTGIMVARPNGD